MHRRPALRPRPAAATVVFVASACGSSTASRAPPCSRPPRTTFNPATLPPVVQQTFHIPDVPARAAALVLLPRHRRRPGAAAGREGGRPRVRDEVPRQQPQDRDHHLRRRGRHPVDPARPEPAGHLRPERHRRPRVVQGPVDRPDAVPDAIGVRPERLRPDDAGVLQAGRRPDRACRSTCTPRCSGTSATSSRRPASPSRRTSSAPSTR